MRGLQNNLRGIVVTIGPKEAATRHQLETAHTIVVKRGQGLIQPTAGAEQMFTAGDVASLSPGRYTVSNTSPTEHLDVLLIAA